MRLNLGFASALLVAAGWPMATAAAVITYSGGDPHVGPLPIPAQGIQGYFQPGADYQADVVANTYDKAAMQLGSVRTLDLESALQTTPTTIQFGPGVTGTLSGTSQSPPSGFAYGLSDDLGSANLGYNVTRGGVRRLTFAPDAAAPTAKLKIDFATPIQGFGLYLTGLSTTNGAVHLRFNDGAAQVLDIAGLPSGDGVQFFGFTDAGARITSLTLSRDGSFMTFRDIFSIDNFYYVPTVPAPAAATLLALGGGLLALRGARRAARQRDPGRRSPPGVTRSALSTRQTTS